MKKSLKLEYGRPFSLALAFHVALLVFCWLSLHFVKDAPKMSSDTPEIVHATLVSKATTPTEQTAASPLEASLPHEIVPAVKKPPAEPIVPPVKEETPEPPEPKSPLVEAQKSVKIQKPPKKESVVDREDVEKRQKKLQADIQRQLENEQKQEKAQKLAKQQKKLEQLLQQDLANSNLAPEKSVSSKSNRSVKSVSTGASIDNKEIDRYKGLIISAISQHWIIPEHLKNGLECHLTVRVAPGGVVTTVKLVKSSGDSMLDRSAESAVYKASPLPVPQEQALFNEFREFNLVVRPEGILAE